MKNEERAPVLSAIFVDYDNIYLSLKRKNDEAAKRFAKLSQDWLKGIETGSLITATNGVLGTAKRRIVMNRCYGNPVPRRNSHDNSTDMNSFPFVRHHFLRAGCEVVDCPPLTAQLKNSSDIRMVMDVRDYLTHETYFDEFVILSGDADFTPVLQRLRQHARRTVIYCNEYTAQPYTAICDGEVREADLIALLLAQDQSATAQPSQSAPSLESTPLRPAAPQPSLPDLRLEIITEVISSIRTAQSPVPLEALADRAIRILGHEKTVNSSWAGSGTFRELLRQSLPLDIQLTDQPPYLAYDPKRHSLTPQRALLPDVAQHQLSPRTNPPMPPAASPPKDSAFAEITSSPAMRAPAMQPREQIAQRTTVPQPELKSRMDTRMAAPASAQKTIQPTSVAPASQTQQSIARIYEACQAPVLAPAEYRAVFEILADEINEKGLAGAQTLNNVVARAQARGLELRRDDARFILEVVSESDPWFDQGASASLFGGRFRNFVVGRCRSHGLNLSAEELDMVDSWFAGASPAARSQMVGAPGAPHTTPPPLSGQAPALPPQADTRAARWWPQGGQTAATAEAMADQAMTSGENASGDDFPRIIRTRRV